MLRFVVVPTLASACAKQECESRKDQAGTWCAGSGVCADGESCPEDECGRREDGKTEWCARTDPENEPVVCVAPGTSCP